jgi:hypothetical protein
VLACPCGRPLHYDDPAILRQVDALVYLLGEHVPVTTPAGTWLVSRHYIALHGIRAAELPGLGFQEVFRCPRCEKISAHPADLEHGWCGACRAFTGAKRGDGPTSA